MCGIAGILRFDDEPIDLKRAEAMRDALKHRGPDGDGIVELGRCTLVHTRLAVIDQHDGAQPMTLDDAGLTVVFNGEIYNHAELREELQQLGHTFTTDHSDTEVLLHGYREWGTAMMGKLDGMWAFALWDTEKQELLLSRDRAGQKPLYFWTDSSNEWAFASDISTLISGRRPGQIVRTDVNSHLDYFRTGYSFAPCSMINRIFEIKPGQAIHMGAGAPSTAPSPHICYAPIHVEPGEPLQQVEFELSQSIKRRLRSDVPIGTFLSAGIDSSLVAALAQRHLTKAKLPPLQTFSVSMDESLYDESAEAEQIATFLGTKHTTLHIRPGDVMDDLEFLIGVSGEPTGDSSILPTYWLCKAAREYVTVALSGDGGDELFGGYNRYRAMALLAKHGWWLKRLPATEHPEQRNIRARLGRLVHSARLRNPARQYLSMIHLFDDNQLLKLNPQFIEGDHAYAWGQGVPNWHDTGDPIRDAMTWDRDHYLPYDILRKVDRASMAVALEVRCPLLSPGMLALSDRLTTDQLRTGGRPKGLLRDLAKKLLPPAVAKRRKSGFAIPIGQWFRTTLAESMQVRVLDRGYMDRLGLKPDLPEQMCKEHIAGQVDHTHRLFALLQLSIWSQWLKTQAGS